MFYFSTMSRLPLQQETKWANINFERGDLLSAQKSHPLPDDIGETLAFNLIKQSLIYFSFIFLTQKICCAHELNWAKVKYELLSTVAYQWLLISAPHLPASASSPPWCAASLNNHIQKYIIPGCIDIKMLLNFKFLWKIWKNKKWRYQFHVTKEF